MAIGTSARDQCSQRDRKLVRIIPNIVRSVSVADSLQLRLKCAAFIAQLIFELEQQSDNETRQLEWIGR